ncbi:hypothetical protein AN393_01266 [Pseudoalteromonas sp. P1-25]|nr:hypothetical protein AN393_01266 [Pseudoalteromonas sp. P1-25]
MIKLLESFLLILGAFQPLITFLIGCSAVYISVKTYKNSRMSREHEELVQLSKIKRDLYVLISRYHSVHLNLKYKVNSLSSLVFDSNLEADNMKCILKLIDTLSDEANKRFKDAEKTYNSKIDYIKNITTINDALEELYHLERLIIHNETLIDGLYENSLSEVKMRIRAKNWHEKLKPEMETQHKRETKAD